VLTLATLRCRCVPVCPCVPLYACVCVRMAAVGLLPSPDGEVDAFADEEEARRARKIKASVRARSGYVSRVRELAPTVRVGSSLVLQVRGAGRVVEPTQARRSRDAPHASAAGRRMPGFMASV
jgi:hypothetical protein